ncbi:MAG: UDP-3-O-(3-hydroxymyristoyl)glucosamine N-acyltransferase [Campylobacterota bacterium]|nr:UDP-3-O-(3-hydroxymyristoyl)glucosamine N-acyltransferase [Campylobacterota bacterium]
MVLKEIAEILGIGYEGPEIEIEGINTLLDAKEREISFVASSKYEADLLNTKAAAVIVPQKLIDSVPRSCIALVCDESYLKMAILSKQFSKPILDENAPAPIIGKNTQVSSKAHIENGAVIGDNCTILAGAYVGLHVKIGNNVTLHANSSIYAHCEIGNDVIIHSGSVVGSDGFGFAHTKSGEHVKIYQNGNVVIEDDVEIGSNSTIDCAVFGSTLLKRGVKIDNLVQIGHNCVIGEYSIIVSQAGVAGSTTLGRNVVIGGQSAISGHLNIAPFTTFAGRSGATKDIEESGKTFAGFPLLEHRKWLKLQARIGKLLS